MAHKDTAWGILNASVDSPPKTGFRRVDEEVRRLNQVASMSYSQMTPVGQGIPAHIHPSLQVGLLKVPRTDHLERSCLSKISTFEAERLTLAKTPITAFKARHALVWDYYLILNNALRITFWGLWIAPLPRLWCFVPFKRLLGAYSADFAAVLANGPDKCWPFQPLSYDRSNDTRIASKGQPYQKTV